MLLGFTEDADVASLQALMPTCANGKQWADAECQASAKNAQWAADKLADKRLTKVRNYLKKLGAISNPNQITGAFASGNIFSALMTPAQVNLTLAAVRGATVKVTDSDYLQLRVMEDPQEPVVPLGASGSCTNTDSYSFTDPVVARLSTTADVYSDASAASSARIAIIDQGVLPTHTLLAGRLGYVGDCGTTSSSCVGSVCSRACCRRFASTNGAVDTCTSYGTLGAGTSGAAHGTACASLAAGGGNCLGSYRGASSYTVDFFRAFYSIDFVNAFQAAVLSGDSIVSTSLGVNSASEATSAVSLAADSAYDSGVIIFAAAGNFGCSPTYNGGCSTGWGYTTSGTCTAPIAGSIMAPANGHKVMAVGAYSAAVHSTVNAAGVASPSSSALRSVAPMCYSGRGPTKNGRVKPDIMGPTGVEAAYTSTSTTALSYFSGTSAATPNVAGAFAAFMAFRRANKGVGGSVPTKGEFMASIIAAGENFGLGNNAVGAGAYRPGALNATALGNVASNTWATFGFTTAGQAASMTFNATGSGRPIKCAAWWPQGASTSLSNCDLELMGPAGTLVASSALPASVWEKVSVAAPAAGAYTLRITLKAKAVATQQVHAFCFF